MQAWGHEHPHQNLDSHRLSYPAGAEMHVVTEMADQTTREFEILNTCHQLTCKRADNQDLMQEISWFN